MANDQQSPPETDITILYGSQTGNAEELSKRIGYKAKKLGYSILVQQIDEFPLKLLPKRKFILFVCSTTGHGQEPENMRALFNFVRKRQMPRTALAPLKFAVYGIGDSSYAKFNFVSKMLYKRLKDCGGEAIQELVCGDEQHRLGCDEVIYPKLKQLWPKLEHLFNQLKRPSTSNTGQNKKASAGDVDQMPDSSYEVRLYKDKEGPIPKDEYSPEYIKKYEMLTAYCIANERVTSVSHFQDTRFLKFRSETHQLRYQPGDICAILPANSHGKVGKFLKTLDIDPKQRFSLRKKDPNYMINYLYDFIPDGLRVRDVVRYYLDIRSVPRRSFFEFLWPFSKNDLEKNKLKEFASTEGQEDMYDYCVRPKRNIQEVLLDFPHTAKNIKFEYLFDIIPPIKPRSFSIASAAIAHPNEFHLIVGVVKFKTILTKTRKGLCSTYLSKAKPIDALAPGADKASRPVESKLRFFIKDSSFKLPTRTDVPIVMVGPGLGIAPFRSFIEHSAIKLREGRNLLYFGCRYKDKDFYFKDQLNNYVNRGIIELQVAFSRETPQKYVTTLMADDAKLMKTLIMKEGGYLYVAGNSKLPEGVRELLKTMLIDEDQTQGEGESLVTRLELTNRIQYDCW